MTESKNLTKLSKNHRKSYGLFRSARYDICIKREKDTGGSGSMNGKWKEYQYKEQVKAMERFHNLIVYQYFDSYYQESRYAVVLEGTMILSSMEYPGGEIQSLARVYGRFLQRKKIC